jgi:hypothetical protein
VDQHPWGDSGRRRSPQCQIKPRSDGDKRAEESSTSPESNEEWRGCRGRARHSSRSAARTTTRVGRDSRLCGLLDRIPLGLRLFLRAGNRPLLGAAAETKQSHKHPSTQHRTQRESELLIHQRLNSSLFEIPSDGRAIGQGVRHRGTVEKPGHQYQFLESVEDCLRTRRAIRAVRFGPRRLHRIDCGGILEACFMTRSAHEDPWRSEWPQQQSKANSIYLCEEVCQSQDGKAGGLLLMPGSSHVKRFL